MESHMNISNMPFQLQVEVARIIQDTLHLYNNTTYAYFSHVIKRIKCICITSQVLCRMQTLACMNPIKADKLTELLVSRNINTIVDTRSSHDVANSEVSSTNNRIILSINTNETHVNISDMPNQLQVVVVGVINDMLHMYSLMSQARYILTLNNIKTVCNIAHMISGLSTLETISMPDALRTKEALSSRKRKHEEVK